MHAKHKHTRARARVCLCGPTLVKSRLVHSEDDDDEDVDDGLVLVLVGEHHVGIRATVRARARGARE